MVELSFEVAVPALSSQGLAFWWNALVCAAGQGHGHHALWHGGAARDAGSEKGFIMIGDETDGTVIPQDLGPSLGDLEEGRTTISASGRRIGSFT